MVLYVFHFLIIAPTVDFFTPSCLPIADSVFPAWCRSTILFLVSFDSSLVLAIVEFGVWLFEVVDRCFYTDNEFKQMPLIQVTSGGQRSLLKKKLQVCESQQSCLFVGDQILIFHHNLQINSLKILQCDFLDFFFLILSLIVELYLWWKLQASLIFLSGRTCTIGGWLNTFLPHCISKFNFYSIVPWKDILNWLPKCEGCTPFCEIPCVYVYIY